MHRLEEIRPRPDARDNPEAYRAPMMPGKATTPQMTAAPPAVGNPRGPDERDFQAGSIPGTSLKNARSRS